MRYLVPLKEVCQPPRASAFIASLRAIGYSFNTAVADIVDNSVAAKATRIEISFDTDPAWVAIVDDGTGMSHDELIAAMQHGGAGPGADRRADDLGRYGLGLKTASLSQCRRLTVVTLKSGELSAARWDLNHVEDRDDWILLILDEVEINKQPGVETLLAFGHGTVVLWEDFDRATAGEMDPASALQILVLGSSAHLGLVFHRYLDPEHGKPLKITVNRLPVEPADPFIRHNPFTEVAGEEAKTINGHKVTIKAFILPHINKLTADELQAAGGKDRLRESQGFYIYRNRRLIKSGTWFGLLGRNELTRLARIRIDVPNALDHLWALDVKKSIATPPEAVRAVLRQIIHTVAERSVNVFQERRRRKVNGQITYLWDRSAVRGGIRYLINREHPLLSSMRECLSSQQASRLEGLLSALEISLPVRAIYVDQASNESVEQVDTELESHLRGILKDILRDIPATNQRTLLIAGLTAIEPFSNHPKLALSLASEIQ
jgi:hypothetical protein